MMWQIFLGSLTLSVIHALIPNHWIPLITIGKTEGWTKAQTLSATAIVGFAHILSTIIIGIIVGFVGYQLSGYFETFASIIAPLILVALGIIYLVADYIKSRSVQTHDHIKIRQSTGKSRMAILLSLSVAMFLSPCLELEAYFFQAGTLGWKGILIVSLVYLVVTVSGMIILVWLGMQGISRIKSEFLEHHEKQIAGIVLILLGIMAYFVEF